MLFQVGNGIDYPTGSRNANDNSIFGLSTYYLVYLICHTSMWKILDGSYIWYFMKLYS